MIDINDFLLIYGAGSSITAVVITIVEYTEWKNGKNITLGELMQDIMAVTMTYIGLILVLVVLVEQYSDKIIIRGKKAETKEEEK